MLLKGEQLAAHLERELRPLYVVYGDEPLLVIEAADAIRARARQQGYSERKRCSHCPKRAVKVISARCRQWRNVNALPRAVRRTLGGKAAFRV